MKSLIIKYSYSLIVVCLLFLSQKSNAQIQERVTLNGFVKANTRDIMGVTVYNLTSKKGVITSEKGAFKIDVAVNDILEIASLVFKDFKITITPEDVKNKVLTAFLVEMVNNLDEVLILRGDLTGILEYDVAQVDVFDTTIDINLGTMDLSNYQFADDYKSAAQNIITRQGQFYNMPDAMAIVRLVSGLFKNKNKKTSKAVKNSFPSIQGAEQLKIQDTYKPDFFITNYNIPENKVQAFLAFVENDRFDTNLLLKSNEINLLEYFTLKSQVFLKTN